MLLIFSFKTPVMAAQQVKLAFCRRHAHLMVVG